MLEGPGSSYAKIVADSTANGERLTSFELKLHRFVLAELNTHCLMARNSASSRAVPATKQLDRYVDDPAWFVEWPAEQKGMQGGKDRAGAELFDAITLAHSIHNITGSMVKDYLERHPDPSGRLHKSCLARFLEPLQWHTVLITGGHWENFFELRANPLAQPELRVVAELMLKLYETHEPNKLGEGDWHLPYIRDDEEVNGHVITSEGIEIDARQVSSARCGRTSHMTQDGRRNYFADTDLFERLVAPGHWSPLEHVACPWPDNVIEVGVPDPLNGWKPIPGSERKVPKLGKWVGWLQYRHVVEAERGVNSYR
jgi:hypothetical protein